MGGYRVEDYFYSQKSVSPEHEQQQGDDDDDDDEEEEEEEEEEFFHSLNENFRVYEYTESHHFGPHIDERVRTKNATSKVSEHAHDALIFNRRRERVERREHVFLGRL